MEEELPGTLHDAQMRILGMLAQHTSAHFSDLAHAASLTNDHANFHIKKLVSQGLVEHAPKSYGEYRLTRAGKQYATSMNTLEYRIERSPKVSVVLWVSRPDGKVLRQQRLKQPYYGYWSRPTGKVRRGETIVDAASRKLREETGLKADWRILGVEHRIDRGTDGDLYDDKYLFTVEGTNPTGELVAEKSGMHNYWMDAEEYANKEKRFGKPRHTDMTIELQHIDLSEGTFRFDEEDY